jgi:hypothetical protein
MPTTLDIGCIARVGGHEVEVTIDYSCCVCFSCSWWLCVLCSDIPLYLLCTYRFFSRCVLLDARHIPCFPCIQCTSVFQERRLVSHLGRLDRQYGWLFGFLGSCERIHRCDGQASIPYHVLIPSYAPRS